MTKKLRSEVHTPEEVNLEIHVHHTSMLIQTKNFGELHKQIERRKYGLDLDKNTGTNHLLFHILEDSGGQSHSSSKDWIKSCSRNQRVLE